MKMKIISLSIVTTFLLCFFMGSLLFSQNCVTFFKENNFDLPSVEGEISVISIAPDSTVWFGIKNPFGGYGLGKYDGTNWINFNTTNSGIPGNKINAIEFDMNGNVL